jgi:hypothetical protein
VLEGYFGLNMETNPYIQHFKDQAAGKIPKNQKFYIVDQRSGIKANEVIEVPKPEGVHTETLTEHEQNYLPNRPKKKIRITKATGHNGRKESEF